MQDKINVVKALLDPACSIGRPILATPLSMPGGEIYPGAALKCWSPVPKTQSTPKWFDLALLTSLLQLRRI
jgi:hypothetical protein